MIKYICNEEHYSEVLSLISKAKKTLWLGTADLKDLYVERNGVSTPLLGVLSELIERGVDLRLIHAKEPGKVFREEFDNYPALFTGLDHMLCPRVHFKIIVIDCSLVYVGSANLTGAGFGMKGKAKRNFEAGIFTDEVEFVEKAMEQFDSVWRGDFCKACLRKEFCPSPIK